MRDILRLIAAIFECVCTYW